MTGVSIREGQRAEAEAEWSLKALEGLNAANENQQSGIDIVRRARRAPARQIADNAGEDGAWIVGKLLESGLYAQGSRHDCTKAPKVLSDGVVKPWRRDARAPDNFSAPDSASQISPSGDGALLWKVTPDRAKYVEHARRGIRTVLVGGTFFHSIVAATDGADVPNPPLSHR